MGWKKSLQSVLKTRQNELKRPSPHPGDSLSGAAPMLATSAPPYKLQDLVQRG